MRTIDPQKTSKKIDYSKSIKYLKLFVILAILMQIVLSLARCGQEKKRDIPPEIIDMLQSFVLQSKQIVQPVKDNKDGAKILGYFQSEQVRDELAELEEVRSNILDNMSYKLIEFRLYEIVSTVSTLQTDNTLSGEEALTCFDDLIDEIEKLEDQVQYLHEYREMREPWDGSFVQTSS